MQHFVGWIIGLSWLAFIIYWFISSFGVKRDIGRGRWQRWWFVRVTLIFVVIAWFWDGSAFSKALFQSYAGNGFVATVLAPIGAVLCALGIAIAIWARVHLGRNWSPIPAMKEEHELVTSGPYRLVRHPIYTGIILAALGSSLATPPWFIVFVVITIMFIWRVGVEEKYMMQLFPNQYPDYKKRTWALVPWIW